jgi:hypothetical protein
MINRVMNMRIWEEKALRAAGIAGAAALFLFCLLEPEASAEAVSESLRRCIEVVIPSLFAMLAASSLIVRCGAAGLVPRHTGRLSRLLFGMNSSELPVFIFGMLAGYPVGVKMLCEAHAAGRIGKRRVELLAGLCYGAGPAFISGCISRQLYCYPAAGWAIFVSNVSANIVLAVFMSPFLRKTAEEPRRCSPVRITPSMLSECVLRSGRAMADICITITAFSVAVAFFERIGAVAAVGELLGKLPDLGRISGEALAAAVLDVTNIGSFPRGDLRLLSCISGLTSFGGACVLFQLRTLTAGRLSLKPLIAMRAVAAVLSYFICRIIAPVMTAGETLAVSTVAAVKDRSPVPSLLLVAMTVMVMWEYGGSRSQRAAIDT